jgi:hypothetical protein
MTYHVVQFIIENLIPLRIVESGAFKDLVACGLQPNEFFAPPSRRHLKRLISRCFDDPLARIT